VILDSEAVVYLAADDGTVHISFAAAQSRALSHPRRARELADQHPATYVGFDILAHPAAGFS
jgi:ATP-dependent DNA ligase